MCPHPAPAPYTSTTVGLLSVVGVGDEILVKHFISALWEIRAALFCPLQAGNGEVRPEEDKTEKLRRAERPQTKKQLRSFLGLAGYYRKFVPNFAEIATPLTDGTKKGKPETVQWSQECEEAFNSLKDRLTTKPVIVLPDTSKEYTLRTDASDKGLGAILLQQHEGDLRPVAYASKKLNQAEKFWLNTSSVPCGKYGPPYPGKATAAARAALPSPSSACWVFLCFRDPSKSDMDYRIFNVRM